MSIRSASTMRTPTPAASSTTPTTSSSPKWARTELLRGAGITHVTLLGDHDAAFVVRRCVVDYRQPARLDDAIEVRTTIGRVAGAHVDAEQRVVREGALLATVGLRLGCVGRNGRAVRLPTPLRHALSGLVSADQR